MMSLAVGSARENREQSPRVVAVTMTRDEADMLPRWVSYYGGQLGVENLVVLDDNSVDGSTEELPCTLHRLPSPPWRSSWGQMRRQLANGLARGLLACYDVVIFTDVDEFLVPDPGRHSSLLAYLKARAGRDVIAPLAVNVLHNPRTEPALHSGRPVLEQRRFVKFTAGMCKPLIKRIPADWQAGFHGIKARFEIDRELMLVHLKYYDVDALAKVSEHRRNLHESEGRGGVLSAWTFGPDELTSRLWSWTLTPAGESVPEFDPAGVDLSKVILSNPSGGFRADGTQLDSMSEEPLRQLPARFRSVL